MGDLTHPAFQDTFNSHVNLYGSSPQNGSFQLRVVLLYYFAVLPGRELSLVNYNWCLNEYLWSNQDLSR